MTTFLLSPGPFCGQCGHPKQTNRAYRCQSCPCTNHRFATTTRTKTSGPLSPLSDGSQRPARSGGGNLPTRPAQRVPFLRALRRAGWVDLLPLYAGLLLWTGIATSLPDFDGGHLLVAIAATALTLWGLTRIRPNR